MIYSEAKARQWHKKYVKMYCICVCVYIPKHMVQTHIGHRLRVEITALLQLAIEAASLSGGSKVFRCVMRSATERFTKNDQASFSRVGGVLRVAAVSSPGNKPKDLKPAAHVR